MALTRFTFGQSSGARHTKKPSCSAALLLALCYLYLTVKASGCTAAMLPPPACLDPELSSLPRVQKVCSAFKVMAENTQYANDYYMSSKLFPRPDSSDSGSKRVEEPNHVFLRFGRRR